MTVLRILYESLKFSFTTQEVGKLRHRNKSNEEIAQIDQSARVNVCMVDTCVAASHMEQDENALGKSVWVDLAFLMV